MLLAGTRVAGRGSGLRLLWQRLIRYPVPCWPYGIRMPGHLERMKMMMRCYGKVACIRIERQGEFGSGPDMSRTQTRLPLRPSTNMSHTTYVKHTGYQVNIIHHESHVSSNTNKQYSTIHMPMSYSAPKPCGWQRNPTRNRRQLRGWVGGKLS